MQFTYIKHHGSASLLAFAFLVLAGACTEAPEPPRGSPERQLSTTSASESASSSFAPTPEPTTTIRGQAGRPTRIELSNLTSGSVFKQGSFRMVSSAPVFLDEDTVTLVHLSSCCDHDAVPIVTAGPTVFDLVVTHATGEKRHWVFRAVGADQTAPVTFTFSPPQYLVMWIVDAAAGVPTTSNGADAVEATAWQDSQGNAGQGDIDLGATSGAVVLYPLMGSGKASDFVFEPGYIETAEATATHLRIGTAYSETTDTNLAATFVDERGVRRVMSWLFLAIELSPAT